MLPALLLLLALQAPPSCADAAACRTEAEAAAARGEFEMFHDLAWRALQKGRPNDPALMFLLARAQALSGRPDDAIVMLGRLVDMHAQVDLALPDFDRTRLRPGWAGLEARLRPAPRPGDTPAPSPAPAPSAATATPGAPAPETRAAEPAPTPAAPGSTEAFDFDPPVELRPFAIAHDAVSRRFVVGDAPSRRLFVIDEVSRRVVSYVSAASAGFLDELTDLTVDERRGDLWVVSAAGSGAEATSVLHKLQLISGRGLMDARPAESALPVRFVSVAVAPDGTVFALDAAGARVFRLRPGSRTLEVAHRIEARGVTAIAALDERTVFVAAADRLLRVDVAAHEAQPIKSLEDLGGFLSLAPRGAALVGVQRVEGASLVVRVALDNGTRARPRAILAASPSAMVGTLAGTSFYYLAGHAIRSVMVR